MALAAESGRATIRVPFGRYGPGTSRSFLDCNTHGLGSNSEYPHHADMLVDVHILGGQQAIEEFRPTMLIEIEARHTTRYKYTPDDVVEWLTLRGYTMYAWQHTWHPTDHVCPHNNNYLFRPPAE